MASVQLSAAEDSAILSAESGDDARDHSGIDSTSNVERVVALLLLKRSTAGSFQADIPYSDRLESATKDAILDVRTGLDGRIRLTVVTNQRTALEYVRSERPRAVLVEIDGRPASRVQFCETLRKRSPDMAIVAVGEQLLKSEFAYDDFVPLPLTTRRAARVIEKLYDVYANRALKCGPIELRTVSRTVVTPSGEHSLTPKMCALLRLLMMRLGEVVSRSEIMESIWETSYIEDTRTIDVHVRWLRQAIEPDPSSPRYLVTERGVGYSFHCSE